jgi:addiction module HigA family antidote
MVDRIWRILAALDAASTLEALNQPTLRLHMLKGDLKGFWAVTVRANWRIIFRFEDGSAFDVDFVDYHQECIMPMKNPPHPGELLKDNVDELGLSVAEAAKGLGVTRQQLYNVINGKSAITPEMAVRLEKALGGTADLWLRMQVNYDLAQVRRNDRAIKVRRLSPKAA